MTLPGAFHGSQQTKDRYLSRVRRAEQQCRIIQGDYWHDGKGCAIGVMIEGDDHAQCARELNIPLPLVDLLPPIHDTLSASVATSFPARFLAAIPVGADLVAVRRQLIIVCLTDPRLDVLPLLPPNFVYRTHYRAMREEIIAHLSGGTRAPYVPIAEGFRIAYEFGYESDVAMQMRIAMRLLENARCGDWAEMMEGVECFLVPARFPKQSDIYPIVADLLIGLCAAAPLVSA